MGTMLQAHNPTLADFGGAGLENCNENLCRTHPEWILAIHKAYIDAGADILTTNSFQASPIVLEEFGLAGQAHELNALSAQLARQAAGDRFVAGSMGPTTKSLSLRGDVSFEQLSESYFIQARGLLDGGVDLLLVETGFDTRNVKAALLAIQRLGPIPTIISGTIERWGAMLAGQSVDAFYASVAHAKPFAIGLNCATGPDLMTDHIRTLSEMASLPVSCFPNAGLPNEDNQYLETPEFPCRAIGEVREPRLAEHRRRMLRDYTRAYPSHRANGRRQASARCASIASPGILYRHRFSGGRRKRATSDCGRADQRDRLASVQESGGRREVGRGDRDRALAGQERSAHHRRLPAILRSRRTRRYRSVLRQADGQDQSAGDDRHHRSARGGAGARLVPGQEHH